MSVGWVCPEGVLVDWVCPEGVSVGWVYPEGVSVGWVYPEGCQYRLGLPRFVKRSIGFFSFSRSYFKLTYQINS